MTNAGISRDNNFSSIAFNQMEFISFNRDFTSNYMINEKSSHQTLTWYSFVKHWAPMIKYD